jgi:hypothetical protein
MSEPTVYTGPSQIISGGQSGADQGGLRAAQRLGLDTGGFACRGFMTEYGPNPALRLFGLVEHPTAGYPARTRANVELADATVIFGHLASPGSKLTFDTCAERKKPCLTIDPRFSRMDLEHRKFRRFLEEFRPRVLNIAGHRESKRVGLAAAVNEFLFEAISKMRMADHRESAGVTLSSMEALNQFGGKILEDVDEFGSCKIPADRIQ